MSSKIERMVEALQNVLADRISSLSIEKQEVILTVLPQDYLACAEILRDHPSLRFEQLIDLCGVDYQTYAGELSAPARYGVVSQLLSVSQNWRLRLKVFCSEEEFPVVDSLYAIWPSVNWFEREAFDLFGIMFNGHPDLRRILTDYGFIGHPFRKDFPVFGFMEMRYDADQSRVIYQPVTIEPREVTPRIVREKNYGDTAHG